MAPCSSRLRLTWCMLCGGGQPVCDCSLILWWCTHTLAQNTRAEPCLLNPAQSLQAMQPRKSPSIIFTIVFGATVTATVVWLLPASFNEQAEQSQQLRKMGVRVCSSLLCLALVSAAFLAATTSAADSACSKGDAPCFCSAIGGTWRALQAPLLPACKVTYQHQGELWIWLQGQRSRAFGLEQYQMHNTRHQSTRKE